MSEHTVPDNSLAQSISRDDPGSLATNLVSELGSMLEELQRPTPTAPATVLSRRDNQLIQVRLGIASALFTALHCKHGPMATHALRTALRTSVWALQMGLSPQQRDAIEVAALLHDVGLIGVPDRILFKVAPLDSDETLLIEYSRKMSHEILRHACAESPILEIVEFMGAWFDGSQPGYRFSGRQIPLGARMIAIVEAFDAMTNGQAYRRARSQERAMSELFEAAGTQFDPQLVRSFSELQTSDLPELREEIASRWLHGLDPEAANKHWSLSVADRQTVLPGVESLFQTRLLDNMHDAVIFIDSQLQITQWNHGAERLTGIAAASIAHQPWLPSLLGIRDEKGHPVSDDDCPVAFAIRSGVQSLRRLTIRGRTDEPISVDSHIIPITSRNGTILGAILLMHDASPEASLEERCQSLHEKATKDPLTQVANRAEFDRVHDMFVTAHRQQKTPCSLLICDLDNFKRVNDTYGHQAGDDVIKSLAGLLKNACRPGDLVARYGGEEFVMLLANCDNASAARRAEQVRMGLMQIAQPKLGGRVTTVSFGVTEIQPGDTPETMLRRADRGLLMAKSKGRNCVVQLGTGSLEQEPASWRSFWRRKTAGPVLMIRQDLQTSVPLKVAVEKLRGFVADHQATITKVDGGNVFIELHDQPSRQRRRADRPVTFMLDLRFEEEQLQATKQGAPASSRISRTIIHVIITPKHNRDRRQAEMEERAKEVLSSFRSYLMATDVEPRSGVLRRATRILTPWLIKHK